MGRCPEAPCHGDACRGGRRLGVRRAVPVHRHGRCAAVPATGLRPGCPTRGRGSARGAARRPPGPASRRGGPPVWGERCGAGRSGQARRRRVLPARLAGAADPRTGGPADRVPGSASMTGSLPRVNAVRYVLPLREGGSLPGLVEADDLGTYVVKFHGAGQGLSLIHILTLPTKRIV